MTKNAHDAEGAPRTPIGRGVRLALVAVLVVALLLRVPGLLWGLPDDTKLYPYHPDEPIIVEIGSRIAQTGDLNPRFFNYGSLLLYISAAVAKLVGGGSVAHYILLRFLSLCCGFATVWLVFALGRRLHGDTAGVTAAALLAVMPVHTVCSTYATVDSLATLLLVASYWFGSRLLERMEPRDAVLCGLMAGLSAGVKYFGIAGVLIAPAAALVGRRGRLARGEWPWLLAGLGAAVLAFLVTTPYALLDHETFRAGVAFEMAHKRGGGSTVPEGVSGAWYVLTRVGPAGLSITIMALVGLGLALTCRHRRPAGLLLSAWFVMLLALTGSGREVFARYLMALAPFAAVLGAAVVGLLKPTRIPLGIAGLCALYAFGFSAALAAVRTRPDVRDEALAFIKERTRSVAMRDAPWFDDPPIAGVNGGPRTRALFIRAAMESGWKVTITGWDGQALRDSGAELLVVSEFDYRPQYLQGPVWQEAQAFWAEAEQGYRLLREFRSPPTLGPLRYPDHRINDWRYLNPEIRVYERIGAGG